MNITIGNLEHVLKAMDFGKVGITEALDKAQCHLGKIVTVEKTDTKCFNIVNYKVILTDQVRRHEVINVMDADEVVTAVYLFLGAHLLQVDNISE